MGDYDFFHTTKTVKVSGFRSISVEIVFAFCREATHLDFPKGFERTGTAVGTRYRISSKPPCSAREG